LWGESYGRGKCSRERGAVNSGFGERPRDTGGEGVRSLGNGGIIRKKCRERDITLGTRKEKVLQGKSLWTHDGKSLARGKGERDPPGKKKKGAGTGAELA